MLMTKEVLAEARRKVAEFTEAQRQLKLTSKPPLPKPADPEATGDLMNRYIAKALEAREAVLTALKAREAASASAHAPLTRKKVRAQLVVKRKTSEAEKAFRSRYAGSATVVGTATVEPKFAPEFGVSASPTAPEPGMSADPGDLALDMKRAGEEQRAKSDVNYRYSADPARSCGTCRHFIEGGACQLVAGLIRPIDVCDLWSARTNESEAVASFREAYTRRAPQESSDDAAREFKRLRMRSGEEQT